MAISRILTTLAVLFLTLLVVTVWSYPLVNHKESQEGLYNDLFHALASKVNYGTPSSRNRNGFVDGFGSPHYSGSLQGTQDLRWNPQQLKMVKALQDVKEDVGKRDYNDLGFFFGKRANTDDANMQRQSRDYGDLGMFFGKRSGNDVTDDRDFEDFAA